MSWGLRFAYDVALFVVLVLAMMWLGFRFDLTSFIVGLVHCHLAAERIFGGRS